MLSFTPLKQSTYRLAKHHPPFFTSSWALRNSNMELAICCGNRSHGTEARKHGDISNLSLIINIKARIRKSSITLISVLLRTHTPIYCTIHLKCVKASKQEVGPQVDDLTSSGTSMICSQSMFALKSCPVSNLSHANPTQPKAT